MSNYTVTTNFAAKDALASGNPSKAVKGADLTTEFANIATMSTTKQDTSALNQPSGYLGLNANGGVTLTPASGVGVALTGLNGQWTITVNGNATTGGSLGLKLQAGTNSSDGPLNCLTFGGTLFFQARGDGVVLVPDASAALQSAGTRNIPFHGIGSGTYTLTAQDAGRCVNTSAGAVTITVPSGVFSAGDVVTIRNLISTGGTGITITADASMHMYWQNSGSGSAAIQSNNGSNPRTLAGVGTATLIFDNTNQCSIAGPGVG